MTKMQTDVVIMDEVSEVSWETYRKLRKEENKKLKERLRSAYNISSGRNTYYNISKRVKERWQKDIEFSLEVKK